MDEELLFEPLVEDELLFEPLVEDELLLDPLLEEELDPSLLELENVELVPSDSDDETTLFFPTRVTSTSMACEKDCALKI